MTTDEMLRGLVRAAEFKERDDGGTLWDDECRAALEEARHRGWGRNRTGTHNEGTEPSTVASPAVPQLTSRSTERTVSRASMMVTGDGRVLPPSSPACVLPPCQRHGGADDWWTEQHKQCTGSHHIDNRTEVRCSCVCHPPRESRETYLRDVAACHVIDGKENVSPEELLASGFVPERCDCGERGCRGWKGDWK